MATRKDSSASVEAAEGQSIKPDPVKAAQVCALQAKVKGRDEVKCKEWPVLLKRLACGAEGSLEPSDSLSLIMEVQSYMLAPIRLLAHELGNKPVYILLGVTGAGKSLTGNWMLGKKVTKKSKTVEDDSGDEEEVWALEVDQEELHVGADRYNSATFAPNISVAKDFVLIDYPGIGDTTGFEVRLGMDLAFRELLNDVLHKKSVHVLTLLPIEAFSASGKANAAKVQLDKLKRLMPLPGCLLSHSEKADESNSCEWMIGVTKCDSNFIKNSKEEFKAAQEVIENWAKMFQGQSWATSFVASHVVNMNKLIFSKNDSALADFLRKLRDQTHIPQVPMECLQEEVARCFGEDVPLGCLASDCLDQDDLNKLSKVIYSGDLCSSPLVEGLKAPSGEKDAPTLKALDESWAKAEAELKQALAEMKASAAAVRRDSEFLIESSHLSLERRNLVIGHLAKQGQASLKQQFVQAEGDVMMDTVMTIAGQVLSIIKQTQESSCLQKSDQAKVIEKAEQVRAELATHVRELGYKDFRDLAQGRNAAAWLGLGAGACMIGHDLLLLTPAANLVAASGLVATAPFFAVVTLSGIIGAAVLGVCHKMQAGWSAQFRDLLLETLDEMLKTNEALTKHRKFLNGLGDHLRELVISTNT